MSVRRKARPKDIKHKSAHRNGTAHFVFEGICVASGKRQFRKKKHVYDTNQQKPEKVRAYRCEHCGLWHAATVRPQ